MNPVLERYRPMVDFLADMLGDDAEVVLHDLTDVDNSIVAIRNKHISGRDIGAPATNLVLKVMQDAKYGNLDYMANYRGVSASGKELKSSTFFIRDGKARIVGMLCVNVDYGKLGLLRDYLDTMIQPKADPAQGGAEERLSQSIEGLAFDSIESVVLASGIAPERMSSDEKIQIVGKLHDNGAFLIKGSVSKVAQLLRASEATIYRYVLAIKKNKGGDA